MFTFDLIYIYSSKVDCFGVSTWTSVQFVWVCSLLIFFWRLNMSMEFGVGSVDVLAFRFLLTVQLYIVS